MLKRTWFELSRFLRSPFVYLLLFTTLPQFVVCWWRWGFTTAIWFPLTSAAALVLEMFCFALWWPSPGNNTKT